jgi:hypothetical protein
VWAEGAGFVSLVFSLSEVRELERLLELAGFDAISVTRRPVVLRLPPPADFLWQYVSSTPLAPALASLDAHRRAILEHDLSRRWQPFVRNGSMVLKLDPVFAGARR